MFSSFHRVLACMVWLAAAAYGDTLDVARFTPPPGWKATRSDTIASYTHIDERAGTYCMIGVYTSTASKGSPERDFASEWEAVVRKAFTTGAVPKPVSERTSAGLSYLSGSAEATQGRVRSRVKLLVFPAGAKAVSVIVSGSDAKALAARERAITAFLDSLRLASLTVPTPAGWQRSESNGVVALERVEDVGFGIKKSFRLVFTSPTAARDSATSTFDSFYKSLAGATFVKPARPLPLRVRLKSGATLIYDGGDSRLRQGDAQVTGMVYVVVQGGMAVGAIGVFSGWDEALDRSLREVFDGVRIIGTADKEPPLFSAKDISGRWRSSSTALGNWVDAAGNYRGDASVATGETLTLGEDGSFRWWFAAIGSGRTVRSDTSGKFTVEDDVLVMTPRSGERATRYRVTGVGKSADGKGSFLFLGVTRSDFPFLSAGSGRSSAGDVYVGVRE